MIELESTNRMTCYMLIWLVIFKTTFMNSNSTAMRLRTLNCKDKKERREETNVQILPLPEKEIGDSWIKIYIFSWFRNITVRVLENISPTVSIFLKEFPCMASQVQSNLKRHKDQPSGQKRGITGSNFIDLENLEDGRFWKINLFIWIDIYGVIWNHCHQSVFEFEDTQRSTKRAKRRNLVLQFHWSRKVKGWKIYKTLKKSINLDWCLWSNSESSPPECFWLRRQPQKTTELSKFLKALEEIFYLKWVEIMSTKKLPITPLLENLKKKMLSCSWGNKNSSLLKCHSFRTYKRLS